MENKTSKKYIVIVDPQNCTVDLVSSLIARQFSLIGIICGGFSDFMLPRWNANKKNIELTIDFKNLEETLKILKQYSVVAILNTPTSIDIYEKIGRALGFHDIISTEVANLINNKYLTNEFLKNKGIPAVKQYKVTPDNMEEPIQLAVKHIKFPLLVKPTTSAYSFGINICYSEAELRKAVDQLFATKDVILTNKPIEELVIQEFLIGCEYAVCTVSIPQATAMIAVLKYSQEKLYGQNIVRYLETADPADPDSKRIIDYATRVLDALNYVRGLTATEMMLTDKGPILIEVNPRAAGINAPELFKYTIGITQGEATALACQDEEAFRQLVKQGFPRIAYGRIVLLRNIYEGGVLKQATVDEIKNLKSFKQIILTYAVGDTLPVTKDLMTIAANVLIANPNQQQFESDYQRLLTIEQDENCWR